MIRAEVCGSLRRRAETIGDLDILFSSEAAPAVLDAFVKLPQVADGAGARADQGERPAGRRRAMRPARVSRTPSIPSPSIISPARKPTISRCASALWRAGSRSTNMR